uniref:translation initiation factor IF-2-like n=1 Tax=Agelaius phoeniceus TaxID=39638 RepID=UPI0023EE1CB2|nr:translation initiation factor IF-2-like [Agelaius phoeniceus]
MQGGSPRHPGLQQRQRVAPASGRAVPNPVARLPRNPRPATSAATPLPRGLRAETRAAAAGRPSAPGRAGPGGPTPHRAAGPQLRTGVGAEQRQPGASPRPPRRARPTPARHAPALRPTGSAAAKSRRGATLPYAGRAGPCSARPAVGLSRCPRRGCRGNAGGAVPITPASAGLRWRLPGSPCSAEPAPRSGLRRLQAAPPQRSLCRQTRLAELPRLLSPAARPSYARRGIGICRGGSAQQYFTESIMLIKT